MAHHKIPNTSNHNKNKHKCVECGKYEYDSKMVIEETYSIEEYEKLRINLDAMNDICRRVMLHHNHEGHEGCCIHLISDFLVDYKILGHGKPTK